eukprot:333249-Chlamydomonas_euryale.AAC.2
MCGTWGEPLVPCASPVPCDDREDSVQLWRVKGIRGLEGCHGHTAGACHQRALKAATQTGRSATTSQCRLQLPRHMPAARFHRADAPARICATAADASACDPLAVRPRRRGGEGRVHTPPVTHT